MPLLFLSLDKGKAPGSVILTDTIKRESVLILFWLHKKIVQSFHLKLLSKHNGMKTVLQLDSLQSLGLMRTYAAFWILLESIEKLVNNKADEVMNGSISSKECRNACFQLLSSTLHNLKEIMSHFNHHFNTD